MEPTTENRVHTSTTQERMFNIGTCTNILSDSSNIYEHLSREDYMREFNNRAYVLQDQRSPQCTMQAVEQIKIDDLYRIMQKLGRDICDLSLQVKDMEYRNDGYINSKLNKLHEKIDSLIVLEPLE